MKTVLCIGGLDPAGRAGLLADARAVAARGARPLCVATALTFQSSRTVDGYEPVSAAVLERQLAPLLRDETIDAVKLGQLASAENAALLVRLSFPMPLIVDTPLVSSSGAALFPLQQVREAYAPLLKRATLVTPNADEVFLLSDRPASPARADAEAAARALDSPAVLLKGGHLGGDPVVDVLWSASGHHEFSSARLTGRFRGTGCRLASAIAGRLAQGDTLIAAIANAREWLQQALRGES
jgi:hydroxymethylpyrimidine kinase/phosphomethylpyrimidine kinase